MFERWISMHSGVSCMYRRFSNRRDLTPRASNITMDLIAANDRAISLRQAYDRKGIVFTKRAILDYARGWLIIPSEANVYVGNNAQRRIVWSEEFRGISAPPLFLFLLFHLLLLSADFLEATRNHEKPSDSNLEPPSMMISPTRSRLAFHY